MFCNANPGKSETLSWRKTRLNADRIPPNNIEAERWFLAGLLYDNKNIDACPIEKDDFYNGLNASIYGTIKVIVKKNKVTWEVLASALKSDPKLYNYFIDLDINCPEHNAKYHYGKIKNVAVRRKQIELAYKIFNDAHHENINTDESIEQLKAILDKSKTSDETGIVTTADLFEKIDELYEKGLERGLSTGWLSLDDYYTVKPGQITVITGVPSHGKTTWHTNLIVNMAQRHHWKFAVFSPENNPMQRYCAHVAQIYTCKPFGRGNNQRMTKEELEPTKFWIDEHFVFIVPRSDEMRIDNLIQKATICVLKHGVKGIVFDPWNEIDHSRPQGLSETEYISKCLSKIRYFARTYQVHVWLIAHPTKLLKRLDGSYPIPTPYDISGSAHFRNKADNCLTVWRDLDTASNETKIFIQKVRFHEVGKIGDVALNYNPLTQSYSC